MRLTKIFLSLFLGTLLFSSCGSNNQNQDNPKTPILLADREAPIGWVYLKMYQDSTFEFILAGRPSTVFPGTFELKEDTILFNYKDSVPAAGSQAILSEHYVSYINGEYREQVGITKNKIKIQKIEK